MRALGQSYSHRKAQRLNLNNRLSKILDHSPNNAVNRILGCRTSWLIAKIIPQLSPLPHTSSPSIPREFLTEHFGGVIPAV